MKMQEYGFAEGCLRIFFLVFSSDARMCSGERIENMRVEEEIVNRAQPCPSRRELRTDQPLRIPALIGIIQEAHPRRLQT